MALSRTFEHPTSHIRSQRPILLDCYPHNCAMFDTPYVTPFVTPEGFPMMENTQHSSYDKPVDTYDAEGTNEPSSGR